MKRITNIPIAKLHPHKVRSEIMDAPEEDYRPQKKPHDRGGAR